MSTQLAPAPSTKKSSPPQATDRCEAPECGAQAYVVVHTSELGSEMADLQFCGHDYVRFEAKFAALGISISDHRDLINKKPSPAAY